MSAFVIAGMAVLGLLVYGGLWLGGAPSPWPLWVVLGGGGLPLVWGLLVKAWRREFGSDLLAGVSIVTSVLLHEYLAGSLVVLMLSGGEALEAFAVKKASSALEALARRMPQSAHRRGGDVPVALVEVGDWLEIYPHEVCPVDGVVREGQGQMDESYLTGEPFVNPKAPGSTVLSGAVNGDSVLVVEATRKAEDSRHAQIMRVMHESEQRRPRLRRLGDSLGAWYTPLALSMAALAWGLSGDPVRFLAVTVVATPCPLLIAIPVAIIGSISRAAARGIVVRDPAIMEQLDLVTTMIMDKTGTLTYGQPQLAEQTMLGDLPAAEVLRLVAALERYSRHPLALAIVGRAEADKLALPQASEVREPPGEGLTGQVEGRRVQVTSRKRLGQVGEGLPKGTGLECVILVDEKLAALYRFRDTPRADSKLFVQHLGPRHQFQRILIVSGDREEEVRYLADHVGVTEIHASQSPEQKLALVREETSRAGTVYLGDGINDAPALLAATVGLAMGQGSDVTQEAAGAVILDNSLAKVDEFLHISHRLRVVALQSALGGIAISLLAMTVAALGYLPPAAGAITQEVIDLAAILNALRTSFPASQATDFEA